jgi:hypothetical protein
MHASDKDTRDFLIQPTNESNQPKRGKQQKGRKQVEEGLPVD